MCNFIIKFIPAIILCCYALAANSLPDGHDILTRTDSYRIDSEPERVEVDIKSYRADKLDNERRYQVYVKTDRRYLVLSRHPKEKGQKILMLEGKFWLFMPRSKRPIRITPRQRLLGSVSLGDITTMVFSEEYSATIVDSNSDMDGTPAIKLELTARVSEPSYEKILLWVKKNNYFPVKAEFYYKSGKLAKIGDFLEGRDKYNNVAVSGMVLYDKIRKDSKTVLRYLGGVAMDIPDRYFNPGYLIRTNIDLE